MDENESQDFKNGARRGHADGKNRAGLYVIDEEFFAGARALEGLSGLKILDRREWLRGYKYGYLKAAEGSPL